MDIEIDLTNTEQLLVELGKICKEYDNNINNLFLMFQKANTYWHDATASKFFSSLEQEKITNQKEILNIYNKLEIYKFIYAKYIELGKKIKCNLSNKENIINKLNQCINILSNLIKSYNSLNMYFANEKYMLSNEKTKLINSYNTLISSKEKIEKIYKKIEEIETQISNKISKLEIVNIEEYDNTIYIV